MQAEREIWSKIEIYRSYIKDCQIANETVNKLRIIKSLVMFEDILPFLGIYKEIIREIRDELIEAIFSKQLSASSDEYKLFNEYNLAFIERRPFADLYHQEMSKYSLKIEEYDEQIKFFREKTAGEMAKTDSYLKLLSDKDNELESLNESVQNQVEIMHQLEISHKEEANSNSSMKYELENNLKKLTDENENLEVLLKRAKKEIEDLSSYEKGYHNLNKKFANYQLKSTSADQQKETQQISFPLDNHTESLLLMSNDTLLLENILLDDLDKGREEVKSLVIHQSKQPKHLTMTQQLELISNNEKLAQLSFQLIKTRVSFQQNFQKIQGEKRDYDNRRLNTMRRNSLAVDEKYIPELVEIEQMYKIDEQKLNLYAAVLCYSTNAGQSFYDPPELTYCKPCNVKTVICPHKAIDNPMVIELPVGCNQVKLERPTIVQKAITPGPDQPQERPVNFNDKTLKGFRKSVLEEDVEAFISFENLLKGFPTRKFPRSLQLEYLFSVFEDFWSEILAADNRDAKIDGIRTCRENLQLFYEVRYKIIRASNLALYDFLNNLIDAAGESQLLLLFCHILLGNIDGSVLRYILLINECLDVAIIDNEDDLRFFIQTVYPFLEEDEVDNLALSFISFSENKFSQENASLFLMNNIMKLRDPRIQMIHNEAIEFSTQTENAFKYKEYQILLDSKTSIPDKKLSYRLFKEVVRVYDDCDRLKSVPVAKVTQIVTFLSMFEQYENIKIQLEDYRISRGKSQPRDKLRWTYDNIKQLFHTLKDI